MTLDGLKNFGVIHENNLLVQISFVSFVEVWTLNNFERLVFHIFDIFKVNNGFIDLLNTDLFGALENLGKLGDNFLSLNRIKSLLFHFEKFLLWLLLSVDVKAGEINC